MTFTSTPTYLSISFTIIILIKKGWLVMRVCHVCIFAWLACLGLGRYRFGGVWRVGGEGRKERVRGERETDREE
jgi:hypothetical protein